MKKYGLPRLAVALIWFFTSADIRSELLSRMERRYCDLLEQRGRREASKFLWSEVLRTSASVVLFHVRITLIIALLADLFK